jgi:TetR/AcrR family transcriptional regulator, regulator of biofilm formation and stress response
MTRRYDPGRRNRIIDAAIDCIADEGVAGTSHRKVAARAEVPLGSMTYHFDSMDALLLEAFTRFAAGISETFRRRLSEARDQEAAVEAIVALIHQDLQRSRREQVLTYELYTLAARKPEFRTITEQWMRMSRAELERHFPQETTWMLDAYIEGASLHIALDTNPRPATQTRAAIELLCGRRTGSC